MAFKINVNTDVCVLMHDKLHSRIFYKQYLWVLDYSKCKSI